MADQRVEFNAGVLVAAERNAPLDSDQRPDLHFRKAGHTPAQLLRNRLLPQRELPVEQALASNQRQHPADLLLENHHHAQRQIDQQEIDDARQHVEIEEVGEEQQQDNQHAKAQQHLSVTRAFDETDERIDPHVKNQDLKHIVNADLYPIEHTAVSSLVRLERGAVGSLGFHAPRLKPSFALSNSRTVVNA